MLNKHQTAEVEITGYTSEGDGVCRIDGCAVFVPNALQGERALVTVTHVGKTQAWGRLDRLLEKSPHRTNRDCPYAKRCGGCQLWHMDYGEELRFKAQKVLDALNRLGGQHLEDLPITGGDGGRTTLSALKTETQPRPVPLAYRNKAQFPVQTQGGGAVAGFFQQRSHTVVPIDRCLIQDPIADKAKAVVLDWARGQGIPAYDEVEHKGLLRHIFVRKGFATGQVMVCLVVNGDRLPRQEALMERLRREIPGLTSVVLSENRQRTNVVLGERFKTLWGREEIEDELCGFRFRLSPRSFYQVNRDQAQRLYNCGLELAALGGTETVLDLYCGTGTITLALSRAAGKVIGVEVVPQAIRDAKGNARCNGVENVEFLCADAGEAARRFEQSGIKPEVIVVDPPRKGLSREVIDAMLQMSPERIVYISCNPATLARDLAELTTRGYPLTHAEAFDLFPRTEHVETVCLLSKLRTEQKMEIDLDLSELDLTSAESAATYEEIKDYVQEHFGFQVSSLQIAQTKRSLGLPVGVNFNPSKKETHHIPQCPPEKAAAIRTALEHFQML